MRIKTLTPHYSSVNHILTGVSYNCMNTQLYIDGEYWLTLPLPNSFCMYLLVKFDTFLYSEEKENHD